MSDNNKIPRRKALLSTAGFSAAVAGISGVAAADTDSNEDYPGRSGQAPGRSGETPNRPDKDSEVYQQTKEVLEEEWTDEDGTISIPDSELEQWEVTTYDPVTAERRDDVRIYVGKNKNATPVSERSEVSTAWSNLTYIKLGGREAFGYDVELGAGLRVNPSALEASFDFTLHVGGAEFTFWGVTLAYGENDGICSSISPGKFPLEIEGCVDVQWGFGDEVTIGGSVDVCTSNIDELCRGWFDCKQCVGGIGGSRSVNLSDLT